MEPSISITPYLTPLTTEEPPYSEPVVTVDVHRAKNLLASGWRYLDVRTKEEFSEGHLENSLNVPYLFNSLQGAHTSQPKQLVRGKHVSCILISKTNGGVCSGREKNKQFVEQVKALCCKDDDIIVGCRSGVRSLSASEDLINAGFKHVRNMGGGYLAWVENGFQVKNKFHSEL
ncbi:thiosulfate sulfurtransferase 18 isoform X1 [Amborella trichopoda]|uniref:thiosulfate sulfurtransferase 18 isoform X1 n=1 Tax=Amborella trichopoda TaxID=13333 RepID=UPI0005D3AEE3|nr:thiosulfate sulfurtransferase 18 isoform X1 [Amborella trichopoda]|eukprot:XP_011624209.1 thiosulfate sulfurtransferase 18 isoform X1 [Amborella trichopoda]